MTNTPSAPSVILKNLPLFYETIDIMAGEMLETFKEKITDEVAAFADKSKWIGAHVFDDEDDCWVAPPQWNRAAKNARKPVPIAWFPFDCTEANGELWHNWIPLFCNLTGGVAGLSVRANRKLVEFDDWIEFLATSDPAIKALEDLGFEVKDRGDGENILIRPIILDHNLLAEAWETNDFVAALQPVTEALNELPKAVDAVNVLLAKFKKP